LAGQAMGLVMVLLRGQPLHTAVPEGREGLHVGY